MMEKIPGGSEAASRMKEEEKKKNEELITEVAPAYLKPLFPCCGGPVGTVEKCSFLVPADKQEETKKAIEAYKEA